MTKHGGRVSVEFTIRMLRDGGGTVVGMVAILRLSDHSSLPFRRLAPTAKGWFRAAPRRLAKGIFQLRQRKAETPTMACRGGRMIIIEVFARGSMPKYRPPGAAPVWIDTS